MDDASISRSYALPFGFKATFCWRDEHLEIEWHPRFLRIVKQRAWRKCAAAYRDARRDFYTDVSALIGGNILIVDTDLKTIDGCETILAPTKH